MLERLNNTISKDTINTLMLNRYSSWNSQVDNMFQTDLWLMDYGAYGVEVFLMELKVNQMLLFQKLSLQMIEMFH